MRVHELGHIVLYVRDIDVSVDFYSQVLGWKQLKSPDGAPVAVFSSGRTHHELLLIEVGSEAGRAPSGYRAGLYHFGLKVGDSDEELREVLSTLRANGIELAGATDHTVTHSLYIEDPDGNEIELYIDVPGVDWKSNPELLLTPARPLSI